jgi:hypothetical protein
MFFVALMAVICMAMVVMTMVSVAMSVTVAFANEVCQYQNESDQENHLQLYFEGQFLFIWKPFSFLFVCPYMLVPVAHFSFKV